MSMLTRLKEQKKVEIKNLTRKDSSIRKSILTQTTRRLELFSQIMNFDSCCCENGRYLKA